MTREPEMDCLPLRIFDSHCHLDDTGYDADLGFVLARAREAGVSCLLIPGITLETCRKAVEMTRLHAGLFAAVGVHPHDAKGLSENALAALTRLAREPAVKAWGEIGLDFNRMHSPRPVQEQWFIRQLETAEDLELPVILHERDSEGRLLEILRAHPPARAGVVHCFSGTRDELSGYLELGFFIGITGVVTHHERGESLRALLPLIPPERILVETDAPYLTPWPERKRARRNEPAFTATVLRKTAEVLSLDPAELAPVIWANTLRVYGISEQEAETP